MPSVTLPQRRVLTVVLVGALALASVQYANGQETAPEPSAWWLSLEGQYTWVQGDAVDLNIVPRRFTLEPDHGWAGTIEGW